MRRFRSILLVAAGLTLVAACSKPPAEAPAAADDPCALPEDAPPDAECPEGCTRVGDECRQQRGIIVTD